MAFKRTFTARVTRDTALFVFGLLGIGYETLLVHVDRPTLLILFGGMVGLPAFLRQDEKKPVSEPEKTEEDVA